MFILTIAIFVARKTYTIFLISMQNKIKNRSKMKKFAENTWYLIYYLASTIMGHLICKKYSLYSSIENLFKGHPQKYYPDDIRLFVTIQFAFYISSLCFLIFVEKRRSDFGQMIFHHFITLFLIVFLILCE